MVVSIKEKQKSCGSSHGGHIKFDEDSECIICGKNGNKNS